jgi:hypothetical protein
VRWNRLGLKVKVGREVWEDILIFVLATFILILARLLRLSHMIIAAGFEIGDLIGI